MQNEDWKRETPLLCRMTRAVSSCTHSPHRTAEHGRFREQSPSPFLSEIPQEVREEIHLGSARYSKPTWREQPLRQRPSPGAKPALSGAEGRHPLPQAGEGTRNVLSFFKDSPVQFDPSALRPAKTAEAPKAEFKRGQRVRHEMFGDGTILRMEGSGPDAKLTVYFERAGSKKFLAKYASCSRLGA